MLKTHFQEQHPNHLQFQCPTCVQEFDTLEHVNAHMIKHYLYDCTICLRRCGSRTELNRHYIEEHPNDDRSVCQLCNKKFADPSGLAKHRHIHTGERPYFCPFCFQTFNLKASQVNHVRRHINFRPYKCHLCPKACYNSGDLKKHIRIHTGEKPYRCDICNTRFRLKDVLNSHMKTHANIRPFKCFQCPKAFKTKALLRYHLPIHSGIQSFLCPICPEKYYQMTSLRSHIRKIHISKDLKCEICGAVQGHRFNLVDHLLSHRNSAFPVIGLISQKISESPNPYSLPKKKGRPKKISSNSQHIKKNVIENCSVDQSLKSYDGERNQDESNENYDIIEVVENIKQEILDDEVGDEAVSSQTSQDIPLLETQIIEQCLMCNKIFASHDELMEHVYIHI